ncbi:MAG: HD-GYP domain-containing protein [Firmicutes bacterium]|nr:HD-GYP domain-containing protein [Bacillota bacterium]
MAGAVYVKLSPPAAKGFVLNEQIVPFVVAAFTYLAVNYLLVRVIISLAEGIPLFNAIKMDLKISVLFEFSFAPIGLLMVILYEYTEPWSMLLLVPPLLLARNSFEYYLKLIKQARTTIELLADVIDKRDPYTASHSTRVADYAEKIGREMGLPYEQVEKLGMAGRVHDLGKIAISDDILQKPGRLSDEEFAKMKTHPKTGYDILSPLEIYKDLLSYVLYHHERMDGKGYPQGLNSDCIPLGARVLAVADGFDAMTSDRPYRNAKSGEEAVKELVKNRGEQFDPAVVDAFLRVWEKEGQTRGET